MRKVTKQENPSRKALFKMYPNQVESTLLDESLGLHCRLGNALMEEHRRRNDDGEPLYSFTAMCKDLTAWRKRSLALSGLNAQSMQVTAKRVALAFDAFFRRLEAKENPGYPRFKSIKRYKGWGYKSHGDGWKLLGSTAKLNQSRSCTGYTFSAVKLSGIGTISLRGKARFYGTPKTAEVIRRHGSWYLSVTFSVEEAQLRRQSGNASMGFDWGINTLLTQVVGDALTGDVRTVENPRWLKRKLHALIDLQKGISRLEEKAKHESGKSERFPVSPRLQCCYDRLKQIHRQVARQRQDFYHKLTSTLVGKYGLIATEKLTISSMVKQPSTAPTVAASFGAQVGVGSSMLKTALGSGNIVAKGHKKFSNPGLRRSTYDAAGGMLLQMLRYKAEEADTRLEEHPTQMLKPSQRCCCCGKTQTMPLEVRVYTCSCGNVMGRDENSARTMLRYSYEGKWWVNHLRAGIVQRESLKY